MVGCELTQQFQDTARRMESQGLNMDLYMKYTGMTMEQMREQMKPQALKRIQTRLVLEEVVKGENLQVSDERLDEEIAKMAAAYQMEADKLKGYMSDRDKDQMKEDIAVQEAVDFLVEANWYNSHMIREVSQRLFTTSFESPWFLISELVTAPDL